MGGTFILKRATPMGLVMIFIVKFYKLFALTGLFLAFFF